MKCDSPSLIISLIIRQPAKHSYVVSLWNETVKSDSEAIEWLFTLIGYSPADCQFCQLPWETVCHRFTTHPRRCVWSSF
jgi:hypothetical protein